MEKINSCYKNKKILITGGTGSFGHGFIYMTLAKYNPERIIVFSRDEMKQWEMAKLFKNDPRVRFFIGDVRDKDRLHRALDGVDYVVHAAALKQVPAAEYNPHEYIKTNVDGATNVVEASLQAGVQKVVALSTDKAVYPINAMGTSKAMMEKVFVAKSRTSGKTKIIGTRYGNVMASRGSVIPFFIKLRETGELPITDPKMTRFMMTLEDAVDLVLYAFENAKQGDLFVQKSPAATIETLAIALKELFNATNEIHIIGARHGEKMYESLCGKEEMSKAEDLENFYRVPADLRDLNYTKYLKMQSKKYIEQKLLYIENKVLKTTHKGKFLSDGIASDLFMINLI